jgi:hypothetical protein
MKYNFDNLKFVSLITVILIIIAIIYQMQNLNDGYANYKCLQNGYKLAFPEKINSSGLLKPNIKNQFMSYDGLEDGRLTPMTLDNNTREMLNYILGNILNQINNKTGTKYFLRKIDSVNINKEKQGSISNIQVDREIKKRITVDFFAHELTKQETRRFIIIFTIDINRNITVEHINLSNAFHLNYGMNNTSKSVQPIVGLIHTDESLYPVSDVGNINGITNSKLEYSNLTNSEKLTNKNMGFANSTEVGKILFLPAVLQDTGLLNSQSFYPNRKHSGWWDNNGVALVEDSDCSGINDEIKTGLDHGIGTRPLQPYDNPTVARYEGESYKNKNHSLFDLARGNFLGRNLSI